MGAVWDKNRNMDDFVGLIEKVCDWRAQISKSESSKKVELLHRLQRRYRQTVKLCIDYVEDTAGLSTRYGCQGVEIRDMEGASLANYHIKIPCHWFKKKDVETQVCGELLSREEI
jgi:hypothetical protein